MSELSVKKRAEVSAFQSLANDILSRADDAFARVAPECKQLLQVAAEFSISKPDSHDMADIFTAKAVRTHKKLENMMELYIGDEWNNPTEILEWCSFYSGAGAAHCAIAGGLAAREENIDVSKQLSDLQNVYSTLLDKVITALATTK